MKKIYIKPSVRVHHLRVDYQILVGSKVSGAQNALNDQKVLDLDLSNKEYRYTEDDDFIEVE